MTQQVLNFAGPDVTPRDRKRLARQLGAVVALMADQRWRTLAEISGAVHASEPSVSARLRQARNELGYRVERRRVAGSSALFEYRVTLS